MTNEQMTLDKIGLTKLALALWRALGTNMQDDLDALCLVYSLLDWFWHPKETATTLLQENNEYE